MITYFSKEDRASLLDKCIIKQVLGQEHKSVSYFSFRKLKTDRLTDKPTGLEDS